MFAHEFMRNALIAGSFVGLACGLVGYFVVLRAQVFAGDALSHVAFTGALGAAALGLNILAGLFAATILGGIVMGLLGDRARADDVTIGSFFAWTLGIGDIPSGVVPYLVHPWVVANGKLGSPFEVSKA